MSVYVVCVCIVIMLVCLQDPRFNKQVDKFTGYKTKTILCMPILAPDGQVCSRIYRPTF